MLAGVDRVRRSTELERTAYHEAGHVVAAVRQGIRIAAVTILSGDDFGGRTWLANGLNGASEHAGAVMLMAGEAAQNIFAPRSCSFVNGLSEKDHYLLMHWLRQNGHPGFDDHGKLEQKYKRAARAFVREHWPSVDRVALALLKHKTLHGPDVHELIAEKEKAA
jgi:ATP-dependent Zn protease